MYCVSQLANTKLGSPAFKVLQNTGIGDKDFVPRLSQKMVTGSMKILAGRLFP